MSGSDITYSISGLDGLKKAFSDLAHSSELNHEVASALFADASKIAEAAKRLCPVEHGTLRATIAAQPPRIETNRVTCDITAGGPAAPYAVYVHENLRARHTNGTAKFLEIAYLEYLGGGLAELITALRASSALAKFAQRAGG